MSWLPGRCSQWQLDFAFSQEPAGAHKGMIMRKKLYVGNLSFKTTSDELRDTFAEFGAVDSAQVVTDRETGRSRGFGFVEMNDGADSAVESLNGTDLHGRQITVNEARPREDRRPGGGGGGYGGGGYGGGGGGGRRY